MSRLFERAEARIEIKARRRAEARAQALAERLAAELPPGVSARSDTGGVVLTGRGLRLRYARDANLRWLIRGAVG